jgi:mannosyltransferase
VAGFGAIVVEGDPMASAGSVTERVGVPRQDSGENDARAWETPFDGLAAQAMRVPWLWPALLTLLVSLYQLGRPELWRDELSSWAYASDPVSQLIKTAAATNAAEASYYLLLHYWIAAFGDSVDAMRLPSVLAMTGAAACVTLVGRRLVDARAGLLAGLAFALVPSVSRFAQEVRFYALDVLLATLALLLLLRALDAPSVRRWAAYGACIAVLGYIDIIALAIVTGHAVGVALRWWRDRDVRLLGFVPAAAAGIAACLPVVVAGWGQSETDIGWIVRPGLDLHAFADLARNLFFSTSVAAALIVLALLAWTVDWQVAAFVTALAVVPVATIWVISQGPHSYFLARYVLPTVVAWALLAGIALSRLDLRLAAAAVLLIGILGAGDQQVIRGPGAHNWASYPVGKAAFYYLDYAGAASIIASHARAGDGIVYPEGGGGGWLLIAPGVQYYLNQDMPRGVPVPRELLAAQTSPESSQIFLAGCPAPAACLGHESRIWVVVSGDDASPYDVMPSDQAAVLLQNYEPLPAFSQSVRGMTVFLLVRM